jgi:hypothetical protein
MPEMKGLQTLRAKELAAELRRECVISPKTIDPDVWNHPLAN